jgi:hypothetical protein
MKGVILQPTYLPWLGYFEMINSSDIFVVFDNVQFVKKSWQQRNKIKTANEITSLTVPIKKTSRSTKINEIEISYDHGNPLENHWSTIELAYKKAQYFSNYKDTLKSIFKEKYSTLIDLNMNLIQSICKILEIETNIVFASDFINNFSKNNKTENIIDLCNSIGIDHLYDAKGASDFLELSKFKDNNIQIKFQEYTHPTYSQLWKNFVSHLSIIDLIFNEGHNSLKIIMSGR